MARKDQISFTITAFDKVSKPLQKISNKINKMSQPVQRLNMNLQSLGRVAGLKTLGKNFDRLNRKASNFRNTLMKVGIVSGAFVASLIPAFKFEENMSAVLAISGATNNEFKKLIDTAKKLGETTQFSSVKVAEGMRFLSMAGLSVTEVIEGIKPALDLALVGQIELGEAADVATNIMSGFGLQAKDFTRVVDVLAKTVTSSNTNITEMGEAMKFAAPIASSLGVSLENVATLSGALADAGIKGTLTGTNLRRLLLQVVKSQAGFKKLGIQTKDAAGNMLSIVGIIDKVRKKTKGLGNLQRLEIIEKLFGARAAGAVTKIMEGLEIGKIEGLMSRIGDSAGASGEMAAIMADNTIGLFKLLLSAMEGFSIAINDIVGQDIKRLLISFTEMTRSAVAFAKANPRLVRGLIILTGVLGGLAVAMSAIALASTITTVAITTLLSPIGLVVSGVIALIAAITVLAIKFKPVRDFLIGGVKDVIRIFEGLWSLIKMIGGAISGIAKVFQNKSFGFGALDKIPRATRIDRTDTVLNDAIVSNKSETKVVVDFENIPKGVTVTQDRVSGDDVLDLNMGFSMAGA